MTLSLERGFRRITWVVSIGILAVSSIIVCLIWHSEKQSWEEAGKPFQSPSPTVYVSVSNVAFQFVEGFEPRLIKEELDRFMGVRSHVAYKPVAKDAGIKIEDLNIALPNGLSLIMRGSNRDVISHVYLPATNTTSSALYSRKEILQKESMNLLTGAESEILSLTRKDFSFPYAIKKAYHLTDWLTVFGVFFVIAACPWGLFFLVRWVARGFKGN